jgi:hypothetical protein
MPTNDYPPPSPDLGWGQISARNFRVIYSVPNPDLHRFGGDHDWVGCETSPGSAPSAIDVVLGCA